MSAFKDALNHAPSASCESGARAFRPMPLMILANTIKLLIEHSESVPYAFAVADIMSLGVLRFCATPAMACVEAS